MRSRERILYAGAWLALLSAAGLLWFRIYFNSDSLFLENLCNDLFNLGGSWKDWRFPPAPAYVPDTLLYFIGYFLFSSARAHIFFVSACQAVLLALASLWLGRAIRPNLSAAGRTAIVVLVAAATLTQAHSGMWLYFFSTNNHFAALLLGLCALALLASFLETQKPLAGLGFALCLAAADISTSLTLIAVFAPLGLLLLAALGDAYRHDSALAPHRRRIGIALILTVFGFELAKVLDHLLTYNNPLDHSRLAMTPAAAAVSFLYFLKASRQAFDPANPATFLFSATTLAAFGFLLSMLAKRFRLRFAEDASQMSVEFGAGRPAEWKLTALALFLLAATPITLVGALVSGAIVDPACYRYFALPIAVALLLSVLIVDKAAQSRPAVFSGAIALAVLGLLVAAASDWTHTSRITSIVQPQSTKHEDEAAACLSKLRAKGVKLTAGLADYWFSRGLRYRLAETLPITAVTPDDMPQFTMTTFGPVRHPERYQAQTVDFVLVRHAVEGDGVLHAYLGKAHSLLPPGFAIYHCPAAHMDVHVYAGASLDDYYRQNLDYLRFKNARNGSVAFPARELAGDTGRADNDTRVAEAPADAAGFLTRGPYRDLLPGRYRIDLAYEGETSDGAAVGAWDIGVYDDPASPTTLFRGALMPAKQGVATATFEAPSQGLLNAEARVTFFGAGRLRVKSVKLTHVN